MDSSRQLTDGQIPSLRAKWACLSEYVKEIKQSFSRWYNTRHGRKGFFWGERFKRVLVDNGDTLINCLAYIDLTPVRAGLRRLILTEELLGLPEQVAQLTKQVALLTEAQTRTETRSQALSEAQSRTETRLEALIEA